VQRQADLVQVVLALEACGGLADLLDGGQEHADQDRDDRDDHQQLDQGEGTAVTHGRTLRGGANGRGGPRSSLAKRRPAGL
jgi:hypothetical protein